MPFKNQHPLYSTWCSMRQRCRNPNYRQWKDYGGRGIGIDPRWNSFRQFVEDMGPKPSPSHSLDRIDNNKGYDPDNCRWATRKEQQRNQNRCHRLVIEGVEYSLAELAERYDYLKRDTILDRAQKGLPFAQVIAKEKLVSRRAPVEGIAAKIAKCLARTHCKYGHEFTPENTYTPKGKPNQRNCRACHNEKMRQRTAAKKAAKLASPS